MEQKRTLNNMVMIRLDAEYDSLKLKNGTELYIDLSFEPERNATVTGTIWGLPSHLSYCSKPNKNMPWLTSMEAQLGDKCIVYYLSIINALKPQHKRYLLEGEDRYVFVSYEFIFAVIRDDKIIPINGYCLIEPTEDPALVEERERLKKIGLASVVTERRTATHVTYGRVKYLGVPNREYVDENHSDADVDIAVDDVVVIRRTNDIPLQYNLHAKIDGGKPYLRVQRRNIFAKT